jgi:nucleotidyltransferase substrate binding protein (TIGR01987 family)
MDKVLDEIKNITQRYNKISKVLLFGSRARGDHNEKSDYDIAVVAPSIDSANKLRLIEEINNVNTLHKIDLVFINSLNENTAICKNIRKDGKTLMDKFITKATNFKNALTSLHKSLTTYDKNPDLVVRDGVIQRFEFTTELAWKTMREYLITQDVMDINTPRAVLKEAFNNNIITDDEGWLQIMHDRNLTSHMYDEDDINKIFDKIAEKHIFLFDALQCKFEELLKN